MRTKRCRKTPWLGGKRTRVLTTALRKMIASRSISIRKLWRTPSICSASFAMSTPSSTACLARIRRERNPRRVQLENISLSEAQFWIYAFAAGCKKTRVDTAPKKKRPGLHRDAVLPLLIPACAEISCGGGNSSCHQPSDSHKSKESKPTRHAEHNALRTCPL